VLPYFKRCETFEGRRRSLARAARARSASPGAKTPDPLFPAIIEAGRAAGFPVTSDYNGEHGEGFGRSQMTIWKGRRSSAAVAFLRPAMKRPKRHRHHERPWTTRVMLEGTRAVGVEYVKNGVVEARPNAEREGASYRAVCSTRRNF